MPAPNAPTPARPDADPDPDTAPDAAFAAATLAAQSAALAALAAWLESDGREAFTRAVDLIVACADSNASVIVSGLGKSGHVGAKIAATLASLGIPAHAVHPAEAAHGDLGRFRAHDTVICLSKSGETEEVVNLAGILRQDGLPIIAVTAAPPSAPQAPSSLERLATVALRIPLEREAGEPAFVAPTSSTTATMALGDALALAAARRRRFTDDDFRRRHPGGALGGLLRPVVEILRFRAGENLPLVPEGLTVAQALSHTDHNARRPGALVVVDAAGRLTGIFTDGDLRRLVGRDPAALTRPIESVMTRTPRTLPASALVRDAVHMVREFRQDEIPVVDDAGQPVGILDVQDLITMRLVRD
ncbi:MAG: KpsF/GutQ family sugar-phosphate isomerase [Phycisphaerales bacterium]|nr:KpsF/GutQ family sugar-phosphate isomerase [Phycisphaerales bacterium]